MINLIIGILILILGIPVGNCLASKTKEELNGAQKWFKWIIIICLIGGFIEFIVGNDVLMFSLFFIAIITSRSLKIKNKNKLR